MTTAMVEFLNSLCTVLVLSGTATSIAYKYQNFPTPFADTLSAEQKRIKETSAENRRTFVNQVFSACFIVMGGGWWLWRTS